MKRQIINTLVMLVACSMIIAYPVAASPEEDVCPVNQETIVNMDSSTESSLAEREVPMDALYETDPESETEIIIGILPEEDVDTEVPADSGAEVQTETEAASEPLTEAEEEAEAEVLTEGASEAEIPTESIPETETKVLAEDEENPEPEASELQKEEVLPESVIETESGEKAETEDETVPEDESLEIFEESHKAHQYINGVCAECGNIQDGFALVNGTWGLYQNQKLQTSLNGLVWGIINGKQSWYYVEHGVFAKKNGIAQKADHSSSTWYYVQNGVFTRNSGIAKKADGSSNVWYYVANGRFTRKTGIAQRADHKLQNWFFVQNGRYVKKTGIAQKADASSRKWYYVKNGVFTRDTAIAKKADGSSSRNYFVSNGNFNNYTGWKKLNDNWYYLASGAAYTGTHYFGGAAYYFNSYGICSTKYPWFAASELAHRINTSLGNNLYSAFARSAEGSYSHDVDGGVVNYDVLPGYTGVFKLENNYGDCYYFASAFYLLAKELGYDVHLVKGYVPYAAGGLGVHCWCEIDVNGTTQVYDPQFRNQYGSGGYNFYYGQSGTWRYTGQQRIN